MAKKPTGKVNAKAAGSGFSSGSARGLTNSDVSGLLEIRENNAKIIEEAINTQMMAALEAVGLAAEGYAKRMCPADRGYL